MDTITITREQFRKAVLKCNDDFEKIAGEFDKTPEQSLTTITMSLQNVAFAAYVEYELFNEKEGN